MSFLIIYSVGILLLQMLPTLLLCYFYWYYYYYYYYRTFIENENYNQSQWKIPFLSGNRPTAPQEEAPTITTSPPPLLVVVVVVVNALMPLRHSVARISARLVMLWWVPACCCFSWIEKVRKPAAPASSCTGACMSRARLSLHGVHWDIAAVFHQCA